jgi:hypothetical protein
MASFLNRKVRILYRRNSLLHFPVSEFLLWTKIKNKQAAGQKFKRQVALAGSAACSNLQNEKNKNFNIQLFLF